MIPFMYQATLHMEERPSPPRALFIYCAVVLAFLLFLLLPHLPAMWNSSSPPAETPPPLTVVWKVTHLVPQQGSNSYRVFMSAEEPMNVHGSLRFYDMHTSLRVVLSMPYVAEQVPFNP